MPNRQHSHLWIGGLLLVALLAIALAWWLDGTPSPPPDSTDTANGNPSAESPSSPSDVQPDVQPAGTRPNERGQVPATGPNGHTLSDALSSKITSLPGASAPPGGTPAVDSSRPPLPPLADGVDPKRTRKLIEDNRFKRLPGGRSLYLPAVERSRRLGLTFTKGTKAEEDLEIVESIFESYLWAFKELPEGADNHHLIKALLGDNPKKVVFMDESLRLDAQGNLLDRWGTPYFFHKQSSTELEIISAGPDQRLWSSDDIKKLGPESSL